MVNSMISFSKEEVFKILEEAIKKDLGIKNNIEFIQIGELEVKDFDRLDIYFKIKSK